jgi:hypothetical protein
MAEIIELSNSAINFDDFKLPASTTTKTASKTSSKSKKNVKETPNAEIEPIVSDTFIDDILNEQSKAKDKPAPVKGKARGQTKTVIVSEEMIKQHTELTVLINRYLSEPNYEAYLKKLGFKLNQDKLSGMSIEDLDKYLQRIRTAINNKSSTSFVKGSVHVGIKIIEGISQNPKVKPHFDLEGWYASLANNTELDDCLTQLEIENGIVTMLPPHQRLLYILGKSACVTIGTNRMKKVVTAKRAEQHKPAEVEVANTPAPLNETPIPQRSPN